MEKACLGFGGQVVLRDASFRIGEKERIGLVGPNGAGKSTLLRIMMGQQQVDTGAVRHARNLRVGYLPQDVQELPGDTLLRSVLDRIPGRADVEERLRSAEQRMVETQDTAEQMKLAQRLAELSEQLEHFDLFYSERRAVQILEGLGFPESELNRSTVELSGGWKMRAALAGLLFQQPDVLFLDEPTNHLDLHSVLWLDRFLKSLESALVLICHDRDFLNRHISRVLSFEPEGLRSYTGNYDSYLTQREAEEEILGRSLENRERELKRNQAFVDRFKAKASKARQAQSRARLVKKLSAELEADKPISARRKLSFSFPEVARSGRDVVLVKHLAKRFGDVKLYDDLSCTVYSGDRIGIVGRNGAGKTTLLKMMAGELAADGGEIRLGANVQVGYYAQHMADALHPRRTVIDEVRSVSSNSGESFVRGVCGAFLFSGDEVDKVIGVLSGGERARVQLAKLLVNPGNLLLMDEPTNHLDVAAADALADALSRYGGTLIFVSHNTSFVNRLATTIWDIEAGELTVFPGRLDEYLEQQAARDKEASAPKTPAAKTPAARTSQKKPATKPSRPPKKTKAPAAKPPSKPSSSPPLAPKPAGRTEADAEIARLEVRVRELQTDMEDVQQDLADPDVFSDKKRFDRMYRQYQEAEAKVAELEARIHRLRTGAPDDGAGERAITRTVKRRRRRR